MQSASSASPVDDVMDETLDIFPEPNAASRAAAPPTPADTSKIPPETPPSASLPLGLNANGKRVMFENDSSGPAKDLLAAGPSRAREQHRVKDHVHQPSGYTWSRPEDQPGWAWQNKKAQDEYSRALDHVVMGDIIGTKYGDPVTEPLVPE